MDIFASFGTDLKLEDEGTVVALGGASSIKVARAGNKKYGRLLSSLVEKNKLALESKDDSADELSDEIMVDVMAQSILVGWENVTFKGEPLPYSVENAKILLSVKDFRLVVINHSKNIDNYRVVAEVATAKK